MSRLALSSNYNSSERNLFSESIYLEYILAIDQFGFDSFLHDSRAKAAATKTNCHVELTPRILNKRINTSRWTKYAVVSVTAPDQTSLDRCLRLLERQFPIFLHRKEYFRRANVTLFTNDVILPDNTPGPAQTLRSASTMSCCRGLMLKSPFVNDEQRPIEKTQWKMAQSDFEGRYTPTSLKKVSSQSPLKGNFSRFDSEQSTKISKNEIFGSLGMISKISEITGNTGENLIVRVMDDEGKEKEAKGSQTLFGKAEYGNESLLTSNPGGNLKNISSESRKYEINMRNEKRLFDIDFKSSYTSSGKGILINNERNNLKYGTIYDGGQDTKDSYATNQIIPTIEVVNVEGKLSESSVEKLKTANDSFFIKVTNINGVLDVDVKGSQMSSDSAQQTKLSSVNSTINHIKYGTLHNVDKDVNSSKNSLTKLNYVNESTMARVHPSTLEIDALKTSQTLSPKVLSKDEVLLKAIKVTLGVDQQSLTSAKASHLPPALQSSNDEFLIKISDSGSIDVEIKSSDNKNQFKDSLDDGKFQGIDSDGKYNNTESGISKNSRDYLGKNTGEGKLFGKESQMSSKNLKYGSETSFLTPTMSSNKLDSQPIICPRYEKHMGYFNNLNRPIENRRRIRSKSSKLVTQKFVACRDVDDEDNVGNEYDASGRRIGGNRGRKGNVNGGLDYDKDSSKWVGGRSRMNDSSRSFIDEDGHGTGSNVKSLSSILHTGENYTVRKNEDGSVDIEYPPTLNIKISTHSGSSNNSTASRSITPAYSGESNRHMITQSSVESINNFTKGSKRLGVSFVDSNSQRSSLLINIKLSYTVIQNPMEGYTGKCDMFVKIPRDFERASSTTYEKTPKKIASSSSIAIRNSPQIISTSKSSNKLSLDSENSARKNVNDVKSNQGVSSIPLTITIKKAEENDPEPISAVLEIHKSTLSSEGIVLLSDQQQDAMEFQLAETNDDSSKHIKVTVTNLKSNSKKETESLSQDVTKKSNKIANVRTVTEMESLNQDALNKTTDNGSVQKVSGIKIDIVHSQSSLEYPKGVYLKGVNESTSVAKTNISNVDTQPNDNDIVTFISSKIGNPPDGVLIIMFDGLNIFSTGSKSVAIRPTLKDADKGIYNFESTNYSITAKYRSGPSRSATSNLTG